MVFTAFREWESWLPGRCAVCHAWPSNAVCEDCVRLFGQPQTRCRTCAVSLPETTTRCGACLRQTPPLAAVLAAVNYDYPWAQMVREFKFHGDIAWARSFSRMMRSTPWVDPALEAADWIVPMPLSKQRLLERGFNQSAVLAEALQTGPQRKVRQDVLVRVRDTAAQSSLPRTERHANMADAFAVHPDWFAALRGKKVVVVDDVMTTGASLHAAAHALAQAGVAQTVALVFARTP